MVGDNIRAVRSELGLTQSEFAEKIGIKQSMVASLEGNRTNLVERTRKAICNAFNVREEFLMTGNGEMFITRDESDGIKKIREEYSLNNREVAGLKAFLNMPPQSRDAILQWGENFLIELAKQLGVNFADLLSKEISNAETKRKPDSAKTVEEKRAIMNAEMDAEAAAEKRETITSLASTISSGSKRKSDNQI